jgi:hypothetical protein
MEGLRPGRRLILFVVLAGVIISAALAHFVITPLIDPHPEIPGYAERNWNDLTPCCAPLGGVVAFIVLFFVVRRRNRSV